MKRVLTIICVYVLLTGLSVGQDTKSPNQPIDPAYRADIVKLIKVTGRESTAKNGLESWLVPYKAMNPSAPDELWSNFIDIAYDELLLKIIPVYTMYYTHQEVKDLLAFYQSPIGKKSLSTDAQIRKDAETACDRLNDELVARMKIELSKAGL